MKKKTDRDLKPKLISKTFHTKKCGGKKEGSGQARSSQWIMPRSDCHFDFDGEFFFKTIDCGNVQEKQSIPLCDREFVPKELLPLSQKQIVSLCCCGKIARHENKGSFKSAKSAAKKRHATAGTVTVQTSIDTVVGAQDEPKLLEMVDVSTVGFVQSSELKVGDILERITTSRHFDGGGGEAGINQLTDVQLTDVEDRTEDEVEDWLLFVGQILTSLVFSPSAKNILQVQDTTFELLHQDPPFFQFYIDATDDIVFKTETSHDVRKLKSFSELENIRQFTLGTKIGHTAHYRWLFNVDTHCHGSAVNDESDREDERLPSDTDDAEGEKKRKWGVPL